jgi:hypothetical protein
MSRPTINAGESTAPRDQRFGRPILCTGGTGPALRVAAYPDGSFTVEEFNGKVLSEHASEQGALAALRAELTRGQAEAHR